MIKYNFIQLTGWTVTKFLPVILLSILLTGCLNDEQSDVKPIPVGYVSLYHASPDADGVDITVDGNRLNNGAFTYTNYTGYLNFYTGNRNLEFKSYNADNELVDTTLNVTAGKVYSVFLVNTTDNLETLILSDSSAAPTEGKAMVRFVQLSPDAPAVDLSLFKDADQSFESNAEFKDATVFREVTADEYSLRVKNSQNGDVILEADDIQLRAGRFYTIITRGFVSPSSGTSKSFNLEVL